MAAAWSVAAALAIYPSAATAPPPRRHLQTEATPDRNTTTTWALSTTTPVTIVFKKKILDQAVASVSVPNESQYLPISARTDLGSWEIS